MGVQGICAVLKHLTVVWAIGSHARFPESTVTEPLWWTTLAKDHEDITIATTAKMDRRGDTEKEI